MTKKVDPDYISDLVSMLKEVDDPRVVGRSKHLLIDILVLSVCAILSGAQSVVDIELYGQMKQGWLKKFLSLPNGIPSHDTLGRVLCLVDPAELERLFAKWVSSIIGGKITSISIDGKSSKGTDRRFNGDSRPLHLVSVYSHEFGLTLCQSESKSSGNAEAEAAVECLKTLDLKGVRVLADAGLNSAKIISLIDQKEGNYIVPIKSNHKNCYAELTDFFENGTNIGAKAKSKDQLHGRDEERACRILSVKGLSTRFKEKWPGAKCVFRIERQRSEKDKRFTIQTTGPDGKQTYERNYGKTKESTTITYYVSSSQISAREALFETRKHWQIENKVHWVLDVAFGEDSWTVRAKRVARNLSAMRRMALNIIRKDKSKGSVRGKIKKAGWNDQILEQYIFGRAF